ncbi:MAG: hypothetical protein IRZ07_03845 [Microbispora sp.]|nr:hypothetical protein [Microbispora sp.]
MMGERRKNGAEMAQIGAAEGRLAPLRHSPGRKAGGNGGLERRSLPPRGENGAGNGAEMAQGMAQPAPLLQPEPTTTIRPIDPAERDRWRRDIERRAAMVRGLSVEDAARKLYAEGLLGRAVLEVLGVEP